MLKEKTYNGIKNKIERNIDIIYNHEKTLEELRKFYQDYPNFKFVISEAKKFGIYNKSKITFYDNKFEKDYLNDIHSFIVLIIGQLIDIANDRKSDCKKEISLLHSALENKNKKDVFYKSCINIKKNPLIWKDIVIAKFLGVPQKIAMLFINDIMYNLYLPKIHFKSSKILIEVNEMNTPDDINYIWQLEVKPLQQAIIKENKFIYSNKKYPNSERDKRYKELRNKGKSNDEARKILEDEGYSIYDYENMSKMGKAYDKKYSK